MIRRLALYTGLAAAGCLLGYFVVTRSPAAPATLGEDAATAPDATVAAPEFAAVAHTSCPPSLFAAGGALLPGTDAFLEQRLQWLLEDYGVPEGAVVAVEPASGRLLAAAGFSLEKKQNREIALSPKFPAASIFKIVTATGLLESGLSPQTKICYHGGKRDVTLDELSDSTRDSSCADLSAALSRSLNVPMAKWADRQLDQQSLFAVCRRFGLLAPEYRSRCFGSALLPDDRLQFAKTAAGFGEVRISAWHAAQLAAVVANRGALPWLLAATSGTPQHVVEEKVAQQVVGMLEKTVERGTARRAFRENGVYLLDGIRAAGKTGSLVEGQGKDWGEVTWFVGFAPVEAPTVAIAAVLVNSPHWRIRASYVGREGLRAALLRSSPYRPTQDRKKVRKKKHRRKR